MSDYQRLIQLNKHIDELFKKIQGNFRKKINDQNKIKKNAKKLIDSYLII